MIWCATATRSHQARSATSLPDLMVKAFEVTGKSTGLRSRSSSAGFTGPSSMARRPMAAWPPGVDRIVMLLCGAKSVREVALCSR
jgi:aspartyl-tRNA synthetase